MGDTIGLTTGTLSSSCPMVHARSGNDGGQPLCDSSLAWLVSFISSLNKGTSTLSSS